MSHMPSFGNPGGTNVVQLTNASGLALAAGTPVYSSAPGSCSPAIATAFATALVQGLLTQDCGIGGTAKVMTTDVLTLDANVWDARTGGAGGLTFGLPYYLDVISGKINAAAPSTIGQFVVLLGVALSTTQLRLLLQPPIGL